MRYNPLPPVEFLRYLFNYSPTTGELSAKDIALPRSPAARPYRVAVIFSGDKYRRVRLEGKLHPTSRIIYKFMTGEDIPQNYHIDHIDGNSRNECWNNLRIASPQENIRNKNSKARYKGVSRLPTGKSHAQIRIGESLRGSIYLGQSYDLETLHLRYCIAAKYFHGTFANYGENSPVIKTYLPDLSSYSNVPSTVELLTDSPMRKKNLSYLRKLISQAVSEYKRVLRLSCQSA